MGMLSNLGKSIKGSLGLEGPSGEDLKARAREAYTNEQKRLQFIEDEKREEAKRAEHIEKMTDVGLTFGDTRRARNLGTERRSLRATGRFNEDRLVL